MNEGMYIYGIIKTSDAQEFGAIGIGDQPSNVVTVGYKDTAAVVSRARWRPMTPWRRKKRSETWSYTSLSSKK